ncbi:MAG: AAA family ATPase [Clostridia bacterium]|nr:AAA family ATPase [Clostridia bacterium]
MKLLKKLLLINWHYIYYEVIEFEHINFLTGKNASGKSTIIDALQLLILGDTSGYFFNKAANDNSQRNLKGYLKGEVADDGETGFIYLRDGIFSSYIAGEFFDTNKKQSFTFGVVFDIYHDEKPQHHFFLWEGPLPQNHFIEDDTPMNYQQLRAFFKNKPRITSQFFESNRSYQTTFKGKMGSLNDKFFSLFRKSVPFSPIMDIERFISEFVCDVSSKVDISDMQDNIRYYKQLEHDVELVRERIARLEEVGEKFQDFAKEDKRLLVQQYLMDRAEKKQAEDTIHYLQKQLAEIKEKREELSDRLTAAREQRDELKEKGKKLLEEKYQSDIYQKSQFLSEQKKRLMADIAKIEGEMVSLVKKMHNIGYLWRENLEAFAQNTASKDQEETAHLTTALREDITYFLDVHQNRLKDLSLDHLVEAKTRMKEYQNRLYWELHDLAGVVSERRKRLKQLNTEIANLEKGIKPYHPKLMELRGAIQAGLQEKYGEKIPVHVFCERLEIRDKKWQDAIEGYLHTQKFYLLVEPKYFTDALKIYDRLKFTRNFYDIGLVDVEKLLGLKLKKEKGSLAEEVVTEDPFARAFADFLLGRVMKCEQVENLRNYRQAITPSCMLYQNFTARQLHPDRWKVPYIGKHSLEQQMKIKIKERELVSQELKGVEAREKIFSELVKIEVITDGEIDYFRSVWENYSPYEELKNQLAKVIETLGRLDLTVLDQINRKINQVEKEQEKAQANCEEFYNKINRLELEEKNIQEEKIPSAEDKLAMVGRTIAENYDQEWVKETGEARFLKEMAKRQSPQSILSAFTSQIIRTRSQRDKKWHELINARSAYNRDYKMSYDVSGRNNDAFEQELTDLKETHLTAYLEKIKDAGEKAQRQFQEYFISKLKENIDTVRGQIEELNTALKDMAFGRDRYRFEIKPNPYYRKFYDMITDPILLEGFNLFSSEFQSKHRDAIDELFKQIVDVGEGSLTADQRAELEKNIEKFTDYRTYLNFDLLVKDDGGRESRLSKMITKKSGGETQTPFYISVLASFVRIYRINQGRGEKSNTLRLIVFDEAFNKMDHQRIQESIRLLKTMGLQAIISAPTEKIGDVAPLVNRNLCVTRIEGRSVVKAFDPKEMLED